jgi:hypothetical protein
MSFSQSVIALIIFSITLLPAFGKYPRGLVANVGGNLITGDDVLKLSSALRLNDSVRIKLFNQAGRDFKIYEAAKKEWLLKFFDQDLKAILYTDIIKDEAGIVKVVTGKRVAFNFKASDYNNLMHELEDKALSRWLDAGEGISAAVSKFGKLLRQRGYPTRPNVSDGDLYYMWREHQGDSLKEKIRINEVKKFERYIGTHNNFDVSSRAYDFRVDDFIKHHKNHVATSLPEALVSKKRAQKLINGLSDSSFVIKKVSFVSLANSHMEVVKDKAPELFANINSLYNKFARQFNSNMADQIASYLAQAERLSQQHSLEELKVEADRQRAFLNRNRSNISKLVLVKSIELAMKLEASDPVQEIDIKKMINELLLDTSSQASLQVRFEQLVLNSLEKYYLNNSISRAIADYITWFVVRDLKTYLSQQKGKIQLSYIDLSDYKARDLAHQKFIQDSVQKKIAIFKQELIERYSRNNYIRLAKDKEFEGREAILFVVD